MKLLSIQVALFPEKVIERPDLVYEEIKKAEGGLFDAMPNIMDVSNAPLDFPLVQAKSSDGMYALNVSKGRVDLLFNFPEYGNSEPFEIYKVEKSKIDNFYKSLLKIMNILRIGVIFNLFEENEEGVKTIYEKYMRTPYTAKCYEISIRTNNQQQIKGFVLNNITIIEGTELHISQNTDNQVKKGVMIQTDVNNVPNQDSILTHESINNIISTAADKLKQNAIKEMI